MEFTRECYKLWLARRLLLLLSSDPGQVEKTFIRENNFYFFFFSSVWRRGKNPIGKIPNEL
jgi:hypothetical protein